MALESVEETHDEVIDEVIRRVMRKKLQTRVKWLVYIPPFRVITLATQNSKRGVAALFLSSPCHGGDTAQRDRDR